MSNSLLVWSEGEGGEGEGEGERGREGRGRVVMCLCGLKKEEEGERVSVRDMCFVSTREIYCVVMVTQPYHIF